MVEITPTENFGHQKMGMVNVQKFQNCQNIKISSKLLSKKFIGNEI